DQGAIIKAMEKQHREELKKAKATSSRKGAEADSRVGYLQTTGNNNSQNPFPPEQLQISGKLITATSGELERLISKMIDQRIDKVTGAQELSSCESPTSPAIERPPHGKSNEDSSLIDIRP